MVEIGMVITTPLTTLLVHIMTLFIGMEILIIMLLTGITLGGIIITVTEIIMVLETTTDIITLQIGAQQMATQTTRTMLEMK